ncbi:MAG: phosphotransferase [Rhizobiales bacterium]|nr:phosphotransferase [Hyphomicrobiales bacterium]
MSDDQASLLAGLTQVAKAHLDQAYGISDLKRLSGGASQETWAFEADHATHSEALILRRRPPGMTERSASAVPLETEASLIEIAGLTGIPVPRVRHVLRPDDGIGEGFIMGRVEGETIARKILRDEEYAQARPKLARQCGEILGLLHSIPLENLPELRHSPAADEIKHYRDLYKAHNHPHPVFEIAFRWLEDNLPPQDEANTLVHGDFRNGNLMIGANGVRAVLDWELAHTGDPMEDLGWICVNAWRFGNIDAPVGGFGQREDMFEGYEATSGRKVDPARVKYWEVLGTMKWGVMCMLMVQAFKSGADRSVERAAIGRRSSENEIDLLRLLAPLGGN